VDVGLLLDASGSIGSRRWKQVVTFTQLLVNSFDVSQEGSHVALLLYSTKTSIEVAFNTFRGADLNAANINAKMAAVNYRNWKGLTYIDRGLKRASDELFREENGMRTSKDIKKVTLSIWHPCSRCSIDLLSSAHTRGQASTTRRWDKSQEQVAGTSRWDKSLIVCTELVAGTL
jgi:hypothetical protein